MIFHGMMSYNDCVFEQFLLATLTVPGIQVKACTGMQILSVCTLHVGVTESFDDQLRSILAQLEYVYIISKYEDSGVPFRTHLYVPEVHPATSQVFYEREDEAHLLKVNILI